MAVKLASKVDYQTSGSKKNKDDTLTNTPITPTNTPLLTQAIPTQPVTPVEENLVITHANSVPTSTDTSTTTTPTVSSTPMTFESYVESQKNKAEAKRNQDIINAQNTYSNALSTHGANAQALSQMGLQGSGYSKYLDGLAYAQRQADINAAYANEAMTKQAINTEYMDYLKNLDEARTVQYNNIYGSISSLSMADIDRLGAQNKLTADQIASLKEAKKSSVYSELSQRDYTAEELEARKGDLNLSDYEKLKENVYNPYDDISESSFSGKTYEEASGYLNEILSNPNVSQAVKDAWRSSFNKAYKVYTAEGVVFNQDGGSERPGKAGNNISVKGQGYGDGIYRVQYNGQKGDDEVKKVADTLPVGTVFMYRGKVYLKYSDGTCYGLEARSNSYKGDLQEIIDKLKASAN